MPAPEELSRDQLVALLAERDARIARQAERIAAQDGQIIAMAAQLADLMEVNDALAARLEHLLSRNSGNSSSPPSRDDDPGKT